MNSRHLVQQAWANLRLEYETSSARPTLRELADQHAVPRSTIFKRAAREKWKQNAALVEATRKQIVEKMEARMEIATTEAADLAAKQFMAELQPWIEREKAEHVRELFGWQSAASSELRDCGMNKRPLIVSRKALLPRRWTNMMRLSGAISE